MWVPLHCAATFPTGSLSNPCGALCWCRQEFQPISPPPGGAVSPTSYSAYYNTSAGKAELLNKMKELPDTAERTSEDEEVDHELAQKKVRGGSYRYCRLCPSQGCR